MHNTLVSVIIPVYNVEKYLCRCLDSVLSQNYPNFEIILVDDGSTDDSGDICDEYARKDSRIKLIHKKNGGSSDARNKGLGMVSGDYLTFIDSDDYVHEDYVSKMLEACEANNCEITQCSFEKGRRDKFTSQRNASRIGIMDHYKIFEGNILKTTVWGKLYKSYLFSTIRFPEGKIHEDEFVTYRAVYKANQIAVLSDQLYYYFQSDNSVMRNQNEKIRLDFLEAYAERVSFFQNAQEDRLVILTKKELAINAMLYYVKYTCISKSGLKKKLIQICKENKRDLITNRAASLMEGCILNLFVSAPDLFTYLVRKSGLLKAVV